MARIKPGVPTVKEIREGEPEYRYIHSTGLVLYTRYNNQLYSTKMHAASTPPVMDKKLEMAIGDRIGASLEGDEFIRADGTVQFTGNQSHGGHDITGVNDLDVDGDVDVDGTANLDDTDIDGTLDVDGATTLDQTTINTTDGDFSVTGPNDISFVTTGTSMDTGIILNSSLNFNMDVTRGCDWNTDVVDWDNSGTFVLTSVDDLTIETSGAATAKTIKLFNDNNHASSFSGIYLKTDAQGTGSCLNNILIECDNRPAKGGGIGVDIRSEDGIRIRGEDATNGDESLVLIRATGSVDIGSGTNDVTQTATAPDRTKIHGAFDISNLYRSDASVPIVMDVGTTGSGSANGTYVKFEALDTYRLIRAMTFKASATVNGTNIGTSHVSHGSYGDTDPYDGTDGTLSIVPPTGDGINHDDNLVGTVWKVTVYFHYGTANPNLQVYYCYASSSTDLNVVRVVNDLDGATTPTPTLTWNNANGIFWTNLDLTNATMKASALRIQSGTLDF